MVVFLGQAGDAGRETGRDDILAVSPSVPRWAGVAHGGQVFSGTAVLGGLGGEWGCEGRWGGGKELHVQSQEGGEVCRELESAHGFKKCL